MLKSAACQLQLCCAAQSHPWPIPKTACFIASEADKAGDEEVDHNGYSDGETNYMNWRIGEQKHQTAQLIL
ncbi:hypothetical protein BT96DRAFT_1005947 [Gymnopus androsaceus JB14]|uniref:Uncharacterized protein n=1 Tax=Gymnopus androsaceus JB14 TaxID=1447944 RepID=A0A6A4GN20_9AGAR|nr:hypothetical protein BT96DRAFT_1005947 [Gymnopus androsaceus JB14]